MTTYTIPAKVLETLGDPKDAGGMKDDDPPVFIKPEGRGSDMFAWHPLERVAGAESVEFERGDLLVLPQSSPALERVLARHMCWVVAPDDAPAFKRHGNECWQISLRFSSVLFVAQLPKGLSKVARSHYRLCPPLRTSKIIHPDSLRSWSLATVCCWLARWERFRLSLHASHGSEPGWLDKWEKRQDLTPWTVEQLEVAS